MVEIKLWHRNTTWISEGGVSKRQISIVPSSYNTVVEFLESLSCRHAGGVDFSFTHPFWLKINDYCCWKLPHMKLIIIRAAVYLTNSCMNTTGYHICFMCSSHNIVSWNNILYTHDPTRIQIHDNQYYCFTVPCMHTTITWQWKPFSEGMNKFFQQIYYKSKLEIDTV